MTKRIINYLIFLFSNLPRLKRCKYHLIHLGLTIA